MDEYIEREAAVELLSQPITMSLCLSVDECHHKIAQRRIDRYLIENIPAADVVEVVRCRECIYAPSGPEDGGFTLEWPHDRWPEDNPCPCKCDDDWYSHKPKPDFYCANGKRKNGGQDDVPM